MSEIRTLQIIRSAAFAAATLGLACSRSDDNHLARLTIPARTENASPKTPRPWYDVTSTQHDFGQVLAGADIERRHTYRVVNISERPLKVSRVVNMRPCCGEVSSVDPVVLGAGQAIEITVTLKIGPSSGRLEHAAIIESDDPTYPEVVLTTLATCLPRAAIDEVVPSNMMVLVGESARAEFEVHSYGNVATPPLDLDDRTVRCNASIEWSGPQSRGIDMDTNASVHRRRLVVTLQARDVPGPRATDILVMDGNMSVARKRITWEVTGAIKATPRGLVVAQSDGESVQKIILQSQDGRPFRIHSATSRVEGLEVRVDNGAKTVHLIEVRVRPPSRPGLRTGEIFVATDHSRQPAVKIAVYVAGPPEDTLSSKVGSR